jgi:catechol 2,3-dioxygenase-like lactoylglutathione lyase family enzyme
VARFPLAHISWAIADNALRKPCDAFFQDVFGARIAYEMLLTPEAEAMGLDREESLMLVGDTMLIPIAPAGKGAAPGAPMGEMLRRSAAPMRWLGLALRVADLAEADAWFSARGFRLHYDPGMESHYFLISRGQVLGVRLELLCHGLPNDPREDPAWRPGRGDVANPLGIEGLQAVSVSVADLAEARALFGERLDLPALGERYVADLDADCAAFDLGDTVVEALCARDPEAILGRHAREIGGIFAVTFKVENAGATARTLEGRGLPLIGDEASRFAIDPASAHGRLIWFTGQRPENYPITGSRLRDASLLTVS